MASSGVLCKSLCASCDSLAYDLEPRELEKVILVVKKLERVRRDTCDLCGVFGHSSWSCPSFRDKTLLELKEVKKPNGMCRVAIEDDHEKLAKDDRDKSNDEDLLEDDPLHELCKLKQAKREIVSACKAASTYVTGASSSSTPSNVEDTGGSTNNSLFEGAWVRSIIGISTKPSRSLVCFDGSDDEKSEDENESDGKRSNSDRNEDQKDATQEQNTKSENEPHHHP